MTTDEQTARTAPPTPYPFSDADRLDVDPAYAQARACPALTRVQLPYGGWTWLATRYDDVKQVVGDLRFSREQALGDDEPRVQPFTHRADAMTMMDPPEHTRLRRIVTKAFSVRRIERMRPRTREIVDELLDDIVRKGAPADLMQAFADIVPMMVICELLGVPYEDRHRFRTWSEILGSTDAGESAEARMARISAANDELRAYLAAMVAKRRAEPAEDLMTVLVEAHDDGERLSEAEMVSLAWAVLLAGYEITACEIGNFAYTLLTSPDHLEQLRREPHLLESAVEEMLRVVPLTKGAFFARRATEDIELGGTLVRKGEAVLPSLMSANRDESVFPDAATMDFTRSGSSHLAFSYGIHHCLGAQLARMELQVVVGALLERFPGLRLAVPAREVVWRSGGILRGPRHLPVAW
ncbi:cytochrome P450 [Yinghuangia sp. YIM S10712]|uniref:cytochrome P450 n=1 Tax=Yinghuangia sp. YIM S10712 TaxID=3436930 RepID=UPI003F538605